MPASVETAFQGTAQAFRGFAEQRTAPDPGRADHRVHRARRAVRELHPSDHDSLDAAVGGCGSDSRPAASAGNDLNVIALIGIILLIGIVKKNAIMMIDFALEAAAQGGQAARRSDLPGVPAALSADHDDHDGGAARRLAAGAGHGNWFGVAPPAGNRDRRRTAAQPAADAVHDPGDFSRLRASRGTHGKGAG